MDIKDHRVAVAWGLSRDNYPNSYTNPESVWFVCTPIFIKLHMRS